MREIIKDELKKKRDHLSEQSLKTYSSLLERMMNKLDIKEINHLEDNKSKLYDYCKNIENPQTRKTSLSPLVILTGDEDYKKLMNESTKIINDKYRNQTVDTDKLKDMKTMDELKNIYENFLKKANKTKSQHDYENVLLSIFFTGVIDGLPPRRLQDYTELYINGDFSKINDNWTDGKNLYFNKFKTVKTNGKQIVPIPKSIQPFIKKAIQNNTSNYLFNNDGEKYSTPTMSKKLKKTFGVSVDGLRAIYISHMYKDMPALKEMEQIAEDMGHSPQTALNHYVKKELQR